MTDTDAAATVNPDEYNGWKNRETWAAALWLNNTPALYGASREIARNVTAVGERSCREVETEYGIESTPERIRNSAIAALREALDFHELAHKYLTDPRDGTPKGMLEDIGSLWRIDYAELYDALTEE